MFNKIKIIIISLIGVTMLLSVFLAFPVSADDVVDDITINVPVSCTLSGTNLTHNASMTGGQYKTDIGSANIKAVCNDTNGLAVYAIGYSNDTFGNDKMISSAVDHTYDIPTGKYTSGATNSSWSIKLAPVSGTYAPTIRNDGEYNYTDFEIIPSTYTKVAYRTSATDSGTGAIGANFTTTYGIYVSTTQPADSYTGKVKFTLVHPNDAPAPKVLPTPPTSCNTPVPNITYMQDITSSNKSTVLASLTEDAPYYLRDSRDEEPYCVSKLEDGNLWLLDNLRLDLTDADTLASVTETNTNASATSLGYLKNGGGTTSDKYAITGVVEWTGSPTYASSYSYSDPLIATSGNGWTKDTTTTSYGNGSGKIGVYYNHCAASAGSYCYGNGTSEGTSSGGATEDLCPAGWRMPTGNTAGEYNTLYGYYGQTATNTASLQYNLSTPLSGYFYSGSVGDQGSYGLFWSSTRRSNYRMYVLYVDSSAVDPARSSDRNYGRSMRCLLQ